METLDQTKNTACAEVAYRLRYMFFLPEPPFRPGTPPARWPAGHRTRHRAATRSSCTAVRELQPLGTPPYSSRVAGVPGMAQAGRRGGREAQARAKATIAKNSKSRPGLQSVRSAHLLKHLPKLSASTESLLKHPQVHSQNTEIGGLSCFLIGAGATFSGCFSTCTLGLKYAHDSDSGY